MDVLYSKTEQLILDFRRNPHSEETIISITELFREMRNVCSVMYANMDYQCGIVYFADGAILQNVIDIISHVQMLTPRNENLEKCFAVGMQLIGNLVVGNTKNQEIILMKYSYFLRNMFMYEGAKNYVFMIYYNCYFGSPHLEQLIISHCEAMTELTNPNLNSEFAEFFIELFLDRCQYFEHFYESVALPKRPCVLEMIRQRYLADRERKFSPSFVTFLQNKFKSYNQEVLLQSFKSRKRFPAKETAAILDLLSNFSSDEMYLKTYQQDFSLFQYTVDLFLTIHYLDVKSSCGFNDIFSKSGSDGFKLGPNSFFGNVQKNPAYLFKVNLVRLISNLAWHNPNLDNKQVEAKNLIPALVDCCRIDACNPFISEWAVFAIRNLRENHINNQRIIELLRRQGTINKQMMKQMNKNIATSNYRFCVPGYKEPPDNGLPIELLDMSQSERKRYLKAYFSSGEPELSPNNSFSSDTSSGTENKKRNKSRRKKRKPKREYHKYSSSSSSPTMFVSDVEYDDDEEDERENNDTKNSDQCNASNIDAKWGSNNEFESGNHQCDYESEEECSNMLSSINLNDGDRNNKNSRNENAFLYENFEKDKQQRRFTDEFWSSVYDRDIRVQDNALVAESIKEFYYLTFDSELM